MNIPLQANEIKREAPQRFLLWQVGWDSYEKILEALNEHHIRINYDRGGLELISWLPIPEAIGATKLQPRQRFVIWNAGWDSYEKIVEALSEQHVRITYERGDIELMSPLPIHEAIAYWFGHLMQVLASELDFPIRGVGGPTLRRRMGDQGIEPDDCYYLTSAAKVVDWATLNMERDPPPDLALEVEITSSCLDRMRIYAGLGVPEIWRYDGEQWYIHRLGLDGAYRESVTSVALPYLPLAEINPLMQQSLHVADDRERFRTLKRWVRERVLPLRQAWEQQQTPPPGTNP